MGEHRETIASVGSVSAPIDPALNVEELMKEADARMYADKEARRKKRA